MAETSEQDRQRDEAGREAIRRLSGPVKGRVILAQAFTMLSALLSFAPYLALVWLGDLFLAGEGPLAQADASKVREIALLLVMAFLSQLFFRALALIITHFADMKLRYVIRKGIVERLSRAPLAWFSATESGKVRSAVQDDTKTVHTVIAHGPVDRLNGVLQPMVLLAFLFWINWRLALIGPSGSGKSTLATLIARFDDPESGSIRLGGVDLRDISSRDLFNTVSFVLQDPMLINASIGRNTSLAKPEASLEEIREAARTAQIDDFIMSLPKGYDSVLGTDCSLSGGESQRVSIARALLADTPILIMDEATAFADPDSELEIQKALSALVEGRTVLAIAHRLNAVLGADQIAVLEEGKIVALGTHAEIQDNEHYQALLKQGGLCGSEEEGDADE